MTIVYFGLSFMFMVLAIHPYTIYPATLWLSRRKHMKAIRPSLNPRHETYAVCVCAYNEETVIREKAENLIALKKVMPSVDIKIYVDAASDRTAAILDEYKDYFDIHVATERHGKTHGMNLLVSKTAASVIIFSDANVVMDVRSIPLLDHYFSDPDVGCVCGHLKYVNANSCTTAATGSLYWQLEELIKQLESDTGSAMGADGSIFAIRRKLHKPPPDDIIDDMFVSLNILCDGYRVVKAPDVIAYENSAECSDEEFKRKIRIACQAFNAHKLLWPRLKNLSTFNYYKYISHKFLRWFTVLWLGLAVLFFEMHLFSANHGNVGMLLIVLVLAIFFIGHQANFKPIMRTTDMLFSLIATGIGILKSLHGERFQTWSPAKSVRNGQ